MAEQPAEAEDVQSPSLSNMPNPVLKQILQYVCSNEGPAALQYRLVSQSFNDAVVMNMRVHLNYKITSEPNRCQISLAGRHHLNESITTDQLVNSRLVERIFSVDIKSEIDDNWDQQDLIKLASELSRPVEVTLHAPHGYPPEPFQLPILPMAEMSQMRVVHIDRNRGDYDLTEAELNFIASLPHLRQLTMSSENLLQLSSHIDTSKISQLTIKWERESQANWDAVSKIYSQVTIVRFHFGRQRDLRFLQNFTRLQTLQFGYTGNLDPTDFLHIDLPHLVECQIPLELGNNDSPNRLFTSMQLAMPNLKKLNCNLDLDVDEHSAVLANQILTTAGASVIQFCPATVEELHFYIGCCPDRSTQTQCHQALNALFTAVLNSRLTRVLVETHMRPVGFDLDAMPFQFKKSRNGVQIGDAVKTVTIPTGLRTRHPMHKYLLKKRNGQICTLDVVYMALDH